jgi:hypothetical protein
VVHAAPLRTGSGSTGLALLGSTFERRSKGETAASLASGTQRLSGIKSGYRTGVTWHRWHSAIWNATLVWQTPQDWPDEISIIEVFFVPLFVLG